MKLPKTRMDMGRRRRKISNVTCVRTVSKHLQLCDRGMVHESKISDEIIRPDKYRKIKSKHFGWSENSGSIAEIVTIAVTPCRFEIPYESIG